MTAENDKDLIQNRLSQDELPITLYHGTYSSCYRSIASNGLLAGGPHKSRTDIHLIQQLPGTGKVISGMRTDCDIALVISPQAAAEAGCIFYRSSNEVYVTEGLEGILPPKFIRAVIIMETREMITSESATTAPSWDAVCEGLLRAEQLYMTVRCSGHVPPNHVTKRSLHLRLALQEPAKASKRPVSSAEQRQSTHLPTCQVTQGPRKSSQTSGPAKHQVTQLLHQMQYASLGKPSSAPTRTNACLKFPEPLPTLPEEPKSAATGTHVALHHQGAALRHCTEIGKCQLIPAGSEAKTDGTPYLHSMQGRRSETQRSIQGLNRADKLHSGELPYRSRHQMCKSSTLSCPARNKKGVEDHLIRPLSDMKKPAAKTSRTAPMNCFSIAITTQSGHRRPLRRSRQRTSSLLSGHRATAATAPEQQPRPSEASTDRSPQGRHPADSQQETPGGTGEKTTSSDQGHTQTKPSQQENAPDTAGQLPERSQAAESSAGRCQDQQGAISTFQAQEGDVSLFADARTRTLARNIGNLTSIATAFADKLKHHCLVCNHWVVDLNTVKTHILRSHPVAWHKCNPTLSQSHSAFEKELKRDFACPYCGKTVFGVARHLTQCPVIMQVAFLHQLAVQEIDPYDAQAATVNISTSQAAQLLTNYEDARTSEQIPGLLHKCYICQADIHDMQTWRRHMKQHHSQIWKQIEGSLKTAVMAQPLPRPCPYCKTQYQKTPAVHVSKCLALQQLLAIRESPTEQIENVRRSSADSSAMGEPKPNGPRASQESTETRRRQRREQIHEESSTTKADDTTANGGGVGGGAPTGSIERSHEHSATDACTPRTRHTDARGGPQLCATPVHTRILHSPTVVPHEPGMEGTPRGRHLRLAPEYSPDDVHTPRTAGKATKSRHGSPPHPEPAGRMADIRSEMAICGMAPSGSQADADNPNSHSAPRHPEDCAGANPGGGKTELRAPLSLHQATQRELPNGDGDNAPHSLHETRGSQTAQSIHGDGRPISHAARRHADQEGAQQTRKTGRGATQAHAKTLAHYFQRGAAYGPRAAEAQYSGV